MPHLTAREAQPSPSWTWMYEQVARLPMERRLRQDRLVLLRSESAGSGDVLLPLMVPFRNRPFVVRGAEAMSKTLTSRVSCFRGGGTSSSAEAQSPRLQDTAVF